MKRILIGLGLLMVMLLPACYGRPKSPSEMTNEELLDAYEQVERDIRNPRETTAPGRGLFNEREILETVDENLEKSFQLQLELREEMRTRDFSPEELKRYNELTGSFYQGLRESIQEITEQVLADSIPIE